MKKCILIIFFLIMVLGCGTRFMYTHLDWFVPWYVDDYISLDSGQKSMLEKRLQRLLRWHCGTQLANYSDFLRNLAVSLGNANQPISYGQVSDYYFSLKKNWEVLVEQVSPDVADILMTATEDQVDELFDNLHRKNQKLKVKHVDPLPEKSKNRRQERMIKRLEGWVSTLTPDQRQAVSEWSRALKPTASEWLQERVQLQEKVRQLLTERTDPAKLQSTLIMGFAYPERTRSTPHQTKIAYNSDLIFKLILRIERTLTPAQRTHLLERIEKFAADFDQLNCAPTQ